MKVILPSHGVFGQNTVDVRTPLIKDLREISDYAQNDTLKKIKYVQMLSDIKLNKVTYFDVEYIYDLLCFATLYSKFDQSVHCECGKDFDATVFLGDLDIVDLKVPNGLPITVNDYNFTLLTAQEYHDITVQSCYEDNEQLAFNDFLVSYTLCHRTLDYQQVKKYVDRLPVSVYLSAVAFHDYYYHGLTRSVNVKCPSCGKPHTVDFKFDVAALHFDTDTLMSNYATLASYIGFEDILNMTADEWSLFISKINKLYSSNGKENN